MCKVNCSISLLQSCKKLCAKGIKKRVTGERGGQRQEQKQRVTSSELKHFWLVGSSVLITGHNKSRTIRRPWSLLRCQFLSKFNKERVSHTKGPKWIFILSKVKYRILVGKVEMFKIFVAADYCILWVFLLYQLKFVLGYRQKWKSNSGLTNNLQVSIFFPQCIAPRINF